MKQYNTLTISKRKARDGFALTVPLMLGCLAFYAAPFVLVVGYSLSWGIGGSQIFEGFKYFQTTLDNELFRLAFGNTWKFLLVGLPLLLVISYAIALMLKNYAKKHKLLKTVVLLPYVMPVVGTVILVELLFAECGILNEGLYTLGLPLRDWLNSGDAFWVTVILYLWKNTGYSVILLLAGLIAIPDDLYDAAGLDGATPWQKFRWITMPQMWYSVFFSAVFSLINAFKCFREIFLIGGLHPNKSIYMLQHFINNSFENLNFPKLAVASVLLFLAMTVVFAFCYRWVLRKEAFRE